MYLLNFKKIYVVSYEPKKKVTEQDGPFKKCRQHDLKICHVITIQSRLTFSAGHLQKCINPNQINTIEMSAYKSHSIVSDLKYYIHRNETYYPMQQ